MVSLIFLFLTFNSFLINKKRIEQNNSEEHFNIFALSLALSIALLGIIGILFTTLSLNNFPTICISLPIFVTTLLVKKYRDNLRQIFIAFKNDFHYFINQYNKKYILLLSLILILLFLSSIGPINNSDAVSVYIGYPYQFWLRNKHFVDGDNHQALLGVADFANIVFFQEKSIWLIRFTQSFIILPIFLLLQKRKINKIVILIILTSPVFIQWMTIGKYFLSEACVGLSFLIWNSQKNLRNTIILLSLIIISISFKVSALLTALPICLYIIYNFRDEIYNFLKNKRQKNLLKSLTESNTCIPLFISIFSLLFILVYRTFLTNNPFYPLLNSFFNSDNKDLINFSKILYSWGREGFYILWLFLPKDFSKVASVLGPATLTLYLSILFYTFNNKDKNRIYEVIGFSQTILLILFCQARADYYYCPLLITFAGLTNQDLNFNFFQNKNLLNLIFKKFLFFTVFIQYIMFVLLSLYSIMIVGYTFLNYESGMRNFAWYYHNSKLIEREAKGKVTDLTFNIPKLFYDKEIVNGTVFNACINTQNEQNQNMSYQNCMNKMGVKTLIVKENKFIRSSQFKCKSKEFIYVTRNIFKKKKYKVDFCEL